MKNYKVFLMGVLAIMLTFGMMAAGCSNPSSTDSGGGNPTPPTTTGGNADLFGIWDGVNLPLPFVLTFSDPNLFVADLTLGKSSGTFTYDPPNLTLTTTNLEGLATVDGPLPYTETFTTILSADKKTLTLTDDNDGKGVEEYKKR
jgi:hypothetical protein